MPPATDSPVPTRRPRARSFAFGVATVLASTMVGLLLAPALFGEGNHATSLPPVPATGTPRFSARAAKVPTLSKYSTIIATSRHRRLRVYRSRGNDARLVGVLQRRVFNGRHIPLVLTVTDHRHKGWFRVRLPVRPNGATAWIRRRDVRTSATNWRVTVQLRRHQILVHHGGVLVLSKPIGVGRSLSPTPTGDYFVTDLVRATDPQGFYGPYAFGLSAFSTVYTSFGGGDGQIGVHGTNAPQALGTDVSHGCIRVRNSVIRKLARELPLGTPVRIER
jgi:hypothetical protein